MSIVEPLFYTSGGIIAFAGLLACLLARVGFSPRLFYYFAGLCLAMSSYQFASAVYLSADQFDRAVVALHWQTLSLMAVIVLGVGFVSLYTGWAHHRKTLVGILLLAVVVVVVDLLADVSIIFAGSEGLETFVMPWGETLYRIEGLIGWTGYSLYLIGVVLFLWCFGRAGALYRRRDSRSLFFAAYVVIQFATVFFGIFLDFGWVDSFELLGFGFLGMVLLVTANLVVEIRALLVDLGSSRQQLNLERTASELLKADQRRLSQVVALSPHSIQLIDTSGKLLHQNRTAGLLWQNPLTEGDNLFEAQPWRGLRLAEMAATVLHRGAMVQEVAEVDATYFRDRDHNRWVNLKVFPVIGQKGERDSVTVIAEDVTREQAIENTLKTLASGSGNGDFYEPICRQVQQMFQARCVILASYSKSLEVQALAALLEGELVNELPLSASDSLLGELFRGYTANISTGLAARYPHSDLVQRHRFDAFVGIPFYDDLGQVIGCLVILNDRSMDSRTDIEPILALIADRIAAEIQRRDAEQRVRRMAYEDFVTGLPNRSALHEHLAKMVKTCDAVSSGTTAFFLDLDHFKTINEALGHDIGDEVLRQVGQRLRDTFSIRSFVARAGGDEFVLVQPFGQHPTDANTIDALATEVINLLSVPIVLGERTISVGTSVGVVRIPEHASSTLDIMRRGDSALFKAKQAGRNCYAVYDPCMQKSIEERLKVEKGLRIALEQNQFGLFYQPKVDLNGRVVGAEALVRWKHPEHGDISPSVFIPVAEKTGLIHLIGDWIVSSLAAELRTWQRRAIPDFGDVAVNLSARQFARADFSEKFLAAIRLNNIDPGLLSIEVTETTILEDIGATRVKLNQLRNAGVAVMLDDFGTGYSSLAYLRELPMDGFKIDRAFVEGLGNTQAEALLLSMLSIGEHMAFKVVAEGVETPAQFDKLRAMGCTLFQGDMFAKPMPGEEFLNWVVNNLEEQNRE